MTAVGLMGSRVRGSVLALAVLLLLPTAASAGTELTWSAAIPVDRHAAGVGMTGVACPAATQCTAIDQQGNEVTFNPEAPANVTALSITGAIPTAIACPSAVQCTAVDSGGVEATFNPQTARLITSAAVDSQGIPISVDCPTAVQCTAVDLSGNEASFDPTTGARIGKESPDLIDSGRTLVAVDCTSPTMCTAVDNGSQNAGPDGITFDPTEPQVTGETTVEGSPAASVGPVALVCQSSSPNCLVVDSGGSLVVFGPSVNSTTSIDTDGIPTALACATDSDCVAVDAGGNEVSINLGANGVKAGGVQPVDPGRVLTGVSCPTSGQCTAVDASGAEVTFDPANPPSTPAPVPVDGSTNSPRSRVPRRDSALRWTPGGWRQRSLREAVRCSGPSQWIRGRPGWSSRSTASGRGSMRESRTSSAASRKSFDVRASGWAWMRRDVATADTGGICRCDGKTQARPDAARTQRNFEDVATSGSS